jgi:hypothetical protein
MTMVVGLQLGSYTMLVADTRMTFYPPNQPSFFEDGKEKIHHTKLGIISGAGNGGLLRRVATRLDSAEFATCNSNTQIERAIIEEFENYPVPSDPDLAERTAETAWLTTYVGHGDDLVPHFRITIMGGRDQRLLRFPDGEVLTLMPPEATDPLRKAVADMLRERMRPLPKFHLGEVQVSVLWNGLTAAAVIQELGKHLEGISRTFQIGIQTPLGSYISDVADVTDEPTKIRFREGDISFSGLAARLEAVRGRAAGQ